MLKLFRSSCVVLFILAGCALADSQVWLRISVLEPGDAAWRVHVVANTARGKADHLYIGDTSGADANAVKPRAADTPSEWVDFSPYLTKLPVVSVSFTFENLKNVRAKFDIATAANEQAIVRSITDYDREWQGRPGNVISLRIPADPVKDRQWLLSIREDAERRLNEIKALKLPGSPRPQKIICMTGFRSNGEFYTDPAIAETDFDIITLLGMNGYWEQNGGQPGGLRKFCKARGLDVTTVYPRIVGYPPSDQAVGGVRLDWPKFTEWLDKMYSGPFAGDPTNPDGVPRAVADLNDEPGGTGFAGPEYQAEFRIFLREKGFTPDFFGKKSWDEIATPTFDWWQYFKMRDPLLNAPLETRRLFYWQVRFWNETTARTYAMATDRVLANDKNVIGTRVNFGPPELYDYGSLPRGTDAFAFGKVRGVSLGFNEDWVGGGNARRPLESNTLLVDFGRAALRPQHPVMGDYITCDANRETVKLRVFGCLAREVKIFDFYYYGPAYTYFDHWSDNFSMVQGVAELTRDMGAVDGLLYAGKAPQARVALLHSKSWPAWKTDDTEQNEFTMAYLALLHAGIPVDIVSDEEVADGRFAAAKYRALYVVNESIPAAALTAIDRWVKKGGRLWAAGWAGMRDEYNEPTAAWNAMFAATSRAWKPTGDLKRLGEQIQPADWTRPIFGREVTGIASPAHRYGRGQVQLVAQAPGKAYLDGAKQVKGSLVKAVVYPEGPARDVYVKFALQAGVKPAAMTSVSQILAFPLWSKGAGVVLLANYTGEPAANLTVRFQSSVRVKTLRSLHHGVLKVKHTGGYYACTVPMDDVTDILVVNQ